MFIEIDDAQQLVDRLGAHLRFEFVSVLLESIKVHLIGKQLASLEIRHSRITHDECFKVEDPLDVAQRHVQEQPHTRRQRLQVPDVRDRTRKLDVPHTLSTNFRESDLDPAFLADDTPMLQTLVLAAQAFVVLDRPEDLRAEQAVPLRFERTVVDGLGFLNLAI